MSRCCGSLQDGCGNVRHFRTPGYKGRTPGSVLTANGHTATDVVMIPIIILGIIIITAIISAAGISGIAAFIVSGLRQRDIDNIFSVVAGS